MFKTIRLIKADKKSLCTVPRNIRKDSLGMVEPHPGGSVHIPKRQRDLLVHDVLEGTHQHNYDTVE